MFIKWKYTKMVENFENQLKRAKECLGVKSDAAFAKAIEMPVTTFSSRKKEQKFPEKELFALKAKCPELNLDMDYILLGHRRETYEAIEQEMLKDMPKPDFSDKTGLLVQLFMQCDDQGRAAILSVAQTMAAMGQTAGTTNIAQQFNNNTISGGSFTVKNK